MRISRSKIIRVLQELVDVRRDFEQRQQGWVVGAIDDVAHALRAARDRGEVKITTRRKR